MVGATVASVLGTEGDDSVGGCVSAMIVVVFQFYESAMRKQQLAKVALNRVKVGKPNPRSSESAMPQLKQ